MPVICYTNTMRYALILLLLLSLPALAEEPIHPQQWQYQKPDPAILPIKPDRCIVAIYLDAYLEDQRGTHVEVWHPPISYEDREWLGWNAIVGVIHLSYCGADAI